MAIINWQIARSPINWIVVFLMILIPIAAWDIAFRYHQANYRPPNI